MYVMYVYVYMYAPTNDADDDSMVEFYEQQQQEVEATPRHDVLIVMELGEEREDNEGWGKGDWTA